MKTQSIAISQIHYDTLMFIQDHQIRYNIPPSMKMLADHFCTSTSNIGSRITKMSREGVVNRPDRKWITKYEFINDFHTDDIEPTLAERIKRIEEHLGLDDL